MKKFFKLIFCIIATTILFFGTLFFIITVCIGDVYRDAYQYIINDKYMILNKSESPKIIYLAGSSGVFGFDSSLFEKKVGMQTINISSHAGFGMEFAANMLKENINEGDIVIIGPEPHLLWGDEINAPTLMTAIDSNIEMYRFLPLRYVDDIIKYFPAYMFKKIDCFKNGYQVEWEVYSTKAFDKKGDMRYFREVIPKALNKKKNINFSYKRILPEKIKYINELNKYIEKQGGTLLFTYAPIYSGYTDNTGFEEYDKYLRKELSCDIISDINECTYKKEYMLDTEYHLNTAGQYKRTLQLVKDFKSYLLSKMENKMTIEQYDKNLTIDLSLKGNPFWHIVNGFNIPENEGIWTGEKSATLGFQFVTDSDILLEITGFPLEEDNINEVYFNSVYIGKIIPGVNEFILKKEWFDEAWQQITFKNDNIQSPLQLGLSEDARSLGCYIQGIKLQIKP